MVIYRKLIIKT